jgi:hypothetical protein
VGGYESWKGSREPRGVDASHVQHCPHQPCRTAVLAALQHQAQALILQGQAGEPGGLR